MGYHTVYEVFYPHLIYYYNLITYYYNLSIVMGIKIPVIKYLVEYKLYI